MHDKTIPSLSSLSANNHNSNQLSALQNQRLNSLNNSSQNRSVTVFGLAFAVSSLGVIFAAPQMAQAALTNLPVSNSHSSIVISQSALQQDRALTKRIEPNNTLEQAVTSSRIEIRSNLNSGIEPVTTVTVPQLPSLSVAQTFPRKTITKQIYTVQAGDTINSIARLHGVSADKILEANEIDNPHQLSVNDQLIIPLEDSAQVSPTNAKLTFSPRSTKFTPSSVTNPISESSSNNRLAQIVTRDGSSNLSNGQENVHDPYISKLRADIDKLRHQFQDQYNTEQSELVVNTYTSPINPEALEPNYSSSPTPSVIQDEQNITSDNNSSSEGLLFSSAISPIDNYNKFLNSRSRETLQPQLPPLSSPEEYLPDDSNFFDGYMWPAQGTFTSGYGWRWGRMHKGIDIAAPIGTPIVAAGAGEVIFAGWNSGGYGNLVKVQHPDGSVTLYAHNNKLLVRQGQKVKQGQQIAEMGSTGYSTGPHLHFEIRPDGSTATNPIALLPKK